MAVPIEAADQQGVEVQAPWRLLRRGHAKIAFSLKELVGLTSQFSMHRSDGSSRTSGCSSRVVRTDAQKFLFVYNVTCSESYSDKKGHTVRLKFDFKKMRETGRADDLDVRVSCSCPAFLWWGAQWNLSTGDALYGQPRPKLQPPTEPKRYQYVICKHVKVVADRISPVLERMLGGYRTKEDEAAAKKKEQEVEVTKQQTQLDAERAERKKQDEKGKAPITPISPEFDDLDAMPDDLTTLGLPAKPEEPKVEEPVTKPITPKVKPPKDLIPEKTRDLLKLPKPPKAEPPKQEETTGPKAQRMLPSNVTVVEDEDEDEPITLLPGAKARRMVEEQKPTEDLGAVDYFPSKVDKPGPKARRMVTPKRKTDLPPNIQLVDDDSDDQVTKINRLRLAGLVLAEAEA